MRIRRTTIKRVKLSLLESRKVVKKRYQFHQKRLDSIKRKYLIWSKLVEKLKSYRNLSIKHKPNEKELYNKYIFLYNL